MSECGNPKRKCGKSLSRNGKQEAMQRARVQEQKKNQKRISKLRHTYIKSKGAFARIQEFPTSQTSIFYRAAKS